MIIFNYKLQSSSIHCLSQRIQNDTLIELNISIQSYRMRNFLIVENNRLKDDFVQFILTTTLHNSITSFKNLINDNITFESKENT